MAGDEALLGDTLTEIESLEARAYAGLAERMGGGLREVRGGLCIHASAPLLIANRVVAVTAELDLDAVASVYTYPHLVTLRPGVELESLLAARGYVRADPWVKYTRDDAPARPAQTDIRVERTDDDGLFAATLAEGFATPPGGDDAFRVLAHDGYVGFLAWAGDEPAGAALLYLDGRGAWFGGTATRPAHRGKGAQTALLAVRIEHARGAGATTLSVETALEGPSSRNVRAAGFREAYVRANWRSPV